MVREILIEKPHQGQQYLIENAQRFNVVCCGRRFGKTVFAKRRLIKRGYEQGKRIAYFAPTYKMLNEVWKELVTVLHPVTLKKDVQQKQILTLTGGIIDFWSLDNIDSARGRAYHEIIVDECAVIPHLLEAWETSLRPLLTDYQGRAWFLSTPKGFASDFYTLFTYGSQYEDWQSFQMPTSTNPRINKDELEQVKAQLPDYAFRQEYLAEFVVYQGMLFADQFDRKKHLTIENHYNPYLDIFLAFDFNVTNSCLVIQQDYYGIYILKEYRVKGWDLERLCQEILSDYPGHYFFVNGDASGRNRSATSLHTAYDMIKVFLDISWDQVKVPNSNPSLIDSRNHVNYLLKNLPIKIHTSCKGLIQDLEAIQTDASGGIDQKQKKQQNELGHLLDCFRYYCYANHQDKIGHTIEGLINS